MDKYFSYCDDTGFSTHNTEEAAKSAAKEYIADYRDKCDPEWNEEVSNTCWGQIRQGVIEIDTGETMDTHIGEVDVVDYGFIDA